MELKGFRELLLKKSQGNEELTTKILGTSFDALADQVLESLEKMSRAKGKKANGAVMSFAGGATNPDINMMHDALSHHLSKFAARNKAHPPKPTTDTITTKHGSYEAPNMKLDPVAAQHLDRAMKLADFAASAANHSHGKLNFEHVSPHAWEMNRSGSIKRNDGSGEPVEDTKGLNRRVSLNSKRSNIKFPDHGYLLLNPHPEYQKKGELQGHTGQYPFEDMKINGKYVDIDPNVSVPDKFEEHPFDKHPVFQNSSAMHGKQEVVAPEWEHPEDYRTAEHQAAHAQKMNDWPTSEHMNNWLESQVAAEDKDPAAYASRGSKKGSLLEGVKKGQIEEAKVEDAQPESKPASTEVKRRTAKEQAPTELSDEDKANLPDALSRFTKSEIEDQLAEVKKNISTSDLDRLPPSIRKILGV